MHPDDRDDRSDGVDVGRALNRLPQPRAPRTLLPRVMAAVAAEAAERHDARSAQEAAAQPPRRPAARPWLAWPVGWQVASAAALIACAIGLARLWPGAEGVIGGALSPIADRVSAVAVDVADRTSVIVTVARVMRALVQPIAGYALIVIFAMGAACATFGAALNRVALGGHS